MLFDAAVRKLHFAKKAVLEKKIEEGHVELTKVQKIFAELMVALDFEKGGELANNLFRIYDFVYHHLVKANIKQDAHMIEEVIPIVENLREGWTKAVDKFLSESDPGVETKKTDTRLFENRPVPEIPKPVTPIPRNISVVAAAVGSKEAPPRPRLNLRG